MFFLCSWVGKAISPPPRLTPQPLSDGLKNALCEKLDAGREHTLCLNNKAVLASDMLILFEGYFMPGKTTQDDVVNLFGTNRFDKVTPFEIDTSFHQYDITGTGLNRIVIWNDRDNIIKSIVFIHPNQLSPLSEDTIVDLCTRLNLANSFPCTTKSTVHAQDFYPAIKETFFNRPSSKNLFSVLEPYEYIEPHRSYKWLFQFHDNINSGILFYFDENRSLENIAYVGDFLPTPLDAEVLADLCRNISMEFEKCAPGTQVYTTDLINEIEAAFPIGTATYEDVQQAIGKYQFRFDYPVRDVNGDEVTLSWYDFVGNNFTRIRFDFDSDFIVRDITFFSGGS